MTVKHSHSANPQQRRGTAATEFAVCLPLLMFVVMAGIQAANVIFLKQTLSIAGYETVRQAVKRDSTLGEAQTKGQQILSHRNIMGASIIVTPDPALTPRGEPVTVLVSAASHLNTPLSDWFLGNHQLTTRTQMVKE